MTFNILISHHHSIRSSALLTRLNYVAYDIALSMPHDQDITHTHPHTEICIRDAHIDLCACIDKNPYIVYIFSIKRSPKWYVDIICNYYLYLFLAYIAVVFVFSMFVELHTHSPSASHICIYLYVVCCVRYLVSFEVFAQKVKSLKLKGV